MQHFYLKYDFDVWIMNCFAGILEENMIDMF